MTDDLVVLTVDTAALKVEPQSEPLTKTQKEFIAQIVKDFDPASSPLAITQYGLGPTDKIGALADPILKTVRGYEAGGAAQLLDNFTQDARKLNFKQLAAPEAIKLPSWLSNSIGALASFKRQVETLDKKMTNAKTLLVKDANLLTARANTLGELERQVLDQIMLLRCYVNAADMKLAELATKKRNALARVATDPLAQGEATKFQGLEARLSARKLALAQMGMIAVQQLYGIRTILMNSTGLLDTIVININAVETVWKTQVVMALATFEQNKIAQASMNAANGLGDMVQATAQMIGQTIENTAQAQNTGIVSIDKLEAANEEMIKNVTRYFEVQREGVETRKAEVQKIDSMKSKLVSAVTEAVKADKSAPATGLS